MKLITTIFTMLIIAFSANLIYAQSVGINNPIPDPTAALDIVSNDKGVLVPRVTTAQRVAIGGGSPATGLLVYDTDVKSFYFYNGADWINLSGGVDTDWTETAGEVHTLKDVGIGISNPNERFQVHAPSGSAFGQFTVTNSGSTGTDGFTIGIDGAQQAYVRQRENLPIFFYTNDQLRMRLTETGRLGVGVNNPGANSRYRGRRNSKCQSDFHKRAERLALNSSDKVRPGLALDIIPVAFLIYIM